MVNFEDPFGEMGDEEEVDAIEDAEADDDVPRPPDEPAAPSSSAQPQSAPKPPSDEPLAEHERPPEERNWERPEVIEKKGDAEYSNYTIREAYDAGTLKAGRKYSTGRGSIMTGLFGARHVLTQHQVDRMKHDEAYRQAVFERGPHGPRGQS